MTIATDTVRALLDEAAADYSAAEEHRRSGLTHRDNAGLHARAARSAGDPYDNAATAHRVTR
ncbi:hypothetical protein [Streptomyces sioyaensis]|uniref:hypothetical protein n=1 Tax=Streptomyces sioyaensis TaxID=67364 RepID=UPI003799E437